MASLLFRFLNRMRTLRIGGLVLDEEGRPIANARVRLIPGERLVTTGPDGAFAFDRLRPQRYFLVASKDNLYAGPSLVRLDESTQAIKLRMHPGATLVLHIAATCPLAGGVRVSLQYVFPVDWYCIYVPLYELEMDAPGTATVRGLAPGYYRGCVAPVAEGWAQAPLSISCDRGATVEHHVTLQHGARIEGIVLGPFGRPVQHSAIRLWGRSRDLYEAESDDCGRWRVDLPPGQYRLIAESERFHSITDVAVDCDGRTSQRDVVVRVGFASPWHALKSLLRLELLTRPLRLRRIAGAVVDERGDPVEGAHVFAIPTSEGGSQRTLRAVTDSHGRFEFEANEDGEYEVKAAWSDARDGRNVAVQRARPGHVRVKLVLAAGGTLIGRVLLDGMPLSHFGVSAQEKHLSAFGTSLIGIQSEDGRFTLDNVDAGDWRIALIGPGTRRNIVDGVAIRSGASIDLGVIVMERGDRVVGHVRDQAGAPVSGARVHIGRAISPRLYEGRSRLEQWFHGEYYTTTNAAGEYVFDGVDTHRADEATALISARHVSAGASLLRELPQGQATINIVLLGAGRITGVVEGLPDHTPIVAQRDDEPLKRRLALTNRDAFDFEDVPPGTYNLFVAIPGSEHVSMRISVIANETATVTLRKTRSAQLL